LPGGLRGGVLQHPHLRHLGHALLVPAADVCRRGAWRSARAGADTCADAGSPNSGTHVGNFAFAHAGTDDGHYSTIVDTHVDVQL